MATDGGSVTKELYKLLRRADSDRLYDGQVEFVLDDGKKMTEDNEQDDVENEYEDLNIFFFVTPKEGLYRGARVKFHMCVNTTYYPEIPPKILCCNRIYHPNIDVKWDHDTKANICINLLDSDWEPEVGLDGAVMAVLFLFYNPQLDDPLSSLCNGHTDFKEFEEAVRCSLRGEEVHYHTFDKLVSDGYDTDANDKCVVLGDCNGNGTPTPSTTAETTTESATGTETIPTESATITPTTEKTAVSATATATLTTESATITTTTETTAASATTIAVTTTETATIETTPNEYSTTPIVIETAANPIAPEADNTSPVNTVSSNQMTGFEPDTKLHNNTHKGNAIKCWLAKLISMFSSHFEAFRKKS